MSTHEIDIRIGEKNVKKTTLYHVTNYIEVLLSTCKKLII